jgi:hypothetical protein
MSVKIKVEYQHGLTISTTARRIDKLPDNCPFCHKGIKPEYKSGWFKYPLIQAIFLCPFESCGKFFISYYTSSVESSDEKPKTLYIYIKSVPYENQKKEFSETIEKISHNLCNIFNEAKEAEERRLMEICGAGYRKALEFLIKDYLIKEKHEKSEVVGNQSLGKCIAGFIDDKRIKDCVKKVAWLGNEESYYFKKWQDKDLSDLKALIDLTVKWIESETLTRKIVEEMPERDAKV